MGGPAEVEAVLSMLLIHDLVSPPLPCCRRDDDNEGGGQEHCAVSARQQGPGMVLSRGICLPPQRADAPVVPMETTFMDMEDNH